MCYLFVCLVFVNSAKNRVKAICNKLNFIAPSVYFFFYRIRPQKEEDFQAAFETTKTTTTIERRVTEVSEMNK